MKTKQLARATGGVLSIAAPGLANNFVGLDAKSRQAFASRRSAGVTLHSKKGPNKYENSVPNS